MSCQRAPAAFCEELIPMTSANLLAPSPITPTVDFDRDGVQHGFLRLPYSRDDSAWGSVMIPIAVIRNGKVRQRF